MKVSHQDDYDTHAIMGGGQVMEFGVAQTAEFFEVLSSTLYSDKPLAVVREVLCNAWDAHIVAGITDKPVEVTLTDQNLIIRDFGHGIAPSKMHPIYCIYGASTKANDGKQTGGFGLGSKAPFAYTTHFTVTTHHMGQKTVYAISRGSAKTQGKPDMRQMVQVPTTECGLEVSIPLKNYSDIEIFRPIIEKIARQGDMTVNYNGKLITNLLAIHKGKEGYIFTEKDIHKESNHKIFIRYGNVLYPVPEDEGYAAEYKAVKALLDRLVHHNSSYYRDNHNWKIIFQAEANTIAVTPSRESLSLVETTIQTLKGLLGKVDPLGSKRFMDLFQNYIKDSINQAVVDNKHYKMLNMEPLVKTVYSAGLKDLYTYEDYVLRCLQYRYPSDNESKKRDITLRLNALIGTKPKNIHVIKEYLKVVSEGNMNEYGSWDSKSWAKFTARNITGPLVVKMMKSELVDIKNLYLIRTDNKSINGKPTFEEIKKVDKLTYMQTLHLLKNFVFVIHNRTKFDEDKLLIDEVATLYGPSTAFLVYIAPRGKGAKDNAVTFFKGIGMGIVDHVAYAEKYEPLIDNKLEKKESVPKIKGIPVLTSLMNGTYFEVRNHMKGEPKRIENPEFVFQPFNLSGSTWAHKFFEFGDTAGTVIIKLYGDKGGICVNSRQIDSYMKKGAKNGYEWLGENILKDIQNSPNILKHISYKLGQWAPRDAISKTIQELYEVSLGSERIKNEFAFPDPLTVKEQQLLQIWNEIKPYGDEYSYRKGNHRAPSSMHVSVNAIEDLFKNVQEDPLVILIRDMVENSKMFAYLDFDEMRKDLINEKIPQKHKEDIENMLLLALQG